MYHVRRKWARIATNQFTADCNDVVTVGETYYSIPDGEVYTVKVCSACAIVDDAEV